MKYFNPSYWFKLWVLSAPLFNDKTQGINAKSINNKNIKDWASKNTTEISLLENQELSLANNQTSLLHLPSWNSNLTTHNEHHKHRHQKSRNRIKKQVTPNPTRSNVIFKLNEKLIIELNNPQQYRNGIQSILESLTHNDILRLVYDDSQNMNWGENSRIFTLNTENYGYFRLPIEIRGEQDGQSYARNLELVLRTDNLYVQGFIVNNNYYYFDFRNVNMDRQPAAVRDGTVPLLRQIEGMTNRQLTNISPDYIDLIPDELPHRVYWTSVYDAFLSLYNIENADSYDNDRYNTTRYSLGIVVFVTAEAMRFPNIYSDIVENLIFRNDFISLQRNRNNPIYNTLVNWGSRSRNEIFQEMLMNHIENRNNPNWNGFTMAQLLGELGGLAVQILLGNINRIRNRNIGRNDNCHKQKRNVINVINKFWHEKFCDLKPRTESIKGKIKILNILDKDLKSNNLNKKDIFVGTTEGLYLIRENGIVLKADNIDNDEITSIKEFGNGNFYVSTKDEQIYFLNTKFINDGHLLGQILSNAESSNLEKELILYYSSNRENHQLDFEPSTSKFENIDFITLNLKNINPLNFKKIEFLGNIDSNCWGTMVNWGSWVYTNDCAANWGSVHKWILNGPSKSIKTKLKENNNNFHNIIENTKNEVSKNKQQYLQSFKDSDGSARILIDQRFGLTWYWENEKYYLKIFGLQYCNWWESAANFNCHMKLGNGIRLYNDDNTFETQIPNPNNIKKRNIISNTTKWTDEFTKSINHEQNLPIINNTNFVKSNITSL